jgi:hypothetical protein
MDKIKIPWFLGRGCHFKNGFFISDVSTFLQKPLSLSAKQPQLAISAMMVLVGLTIVANSIEAALNDCNAAVS